MEGYNAEKRIAMAVTDVRRSLRQTNTCAGRSQALIGSIATPSQRQTIDRGTTPRLTSVGYTDGVAPLAALWQDCEPGGAAPRCRRAAAVAA
jgi:hypothetical protein